MMSSFKNMTNGSVITPAEPPDVNFSNLYPAVIECFAIILCGYMAGRCKLISPLESKGLNVFVGTFSLPALIFVSMAKLDFGCVNWLFLASICVAKSATFALVAAITILVTRPADLGRAGLYAIFVTQSNDFALGYPIVVALYGKDHPEFASYLYLAAPISLVFLNPIGFMLMEIGKRRRRSSSSSSSSSLSPEEEVLLSEGSSSPSPPPIHRGGGGGSCLRGRASEGGRESGCSFPASLSIGRELLTNPFVFMTLAGLLANWIFQHKLPNVLDGVLTVLGQAFSASALFLLGLSMVGKVGRLHGASLVTPGILIAVKTVFLPLLLRETVSLLLPPSSNSSSPNSSSSSPNSDYANFAFLYGTFPTAPGVFVFAAKYDVAVDMISSAMVACTFVSAPLMFASAKMASLVAVSPSDYGAEVEAFLFDVSLVGLVCSTWVVVVFCLTRKWRKAPHFVTLCLALSQGVACCGALMWSQVSLEDGGGGGGWKGVAQFCLFSFGVFSTRVWSAVLGLVLVLLRWRSLPLVLRGRKYLALVGWGVPGVLVGVLLVLEGKGGGGGGGGALAEGASDPIFQYGAAQAVVALIVLCGSLFTTIVSLILHQRCSNKPKYSTYNDFPVLDEEEEDEEEERSRRRPTPPSPSPSPSPTLSSRSLLINTSFNNNTGARVEGGGGGQDGTAVRVGGRGGTRTRRRSEGESSLFSYRDSPSPSPPSSPPFPFPPPDAALILRDRDDEFQVTRHVVLLLLLCGSMLVGLALCLWTIMAAVSASASASAGGLYVELVFVDVLLNFGQGVFTAAIFGLDAKLILVPLLKRWRRLTSGASKLELPPPESLDEETKETCEQFTKYHLDKCVRDIVRDRSWRLHSLPSVFTGTELVDWLLLFGVSPESDSRPSAVRYARRLLQGRLIRHIHRSHHFHDQPLFYTFTSHHTPRDAKRDDTRTGGED